MVRDGLRGRRKTAARSGETETRRERRAGTQSLSVTSKCPLRFSELEDVGIDLEGGVLALASLSYGGEPIVGPLRARRFVLLLALFGFRRFQEPSFPP